MENSKKNAGKAAILYAYNVLRIKNRVKSQKEFADLLGINQQTLSSAMRGRDAYITDNLMRRIEDFMQSEYGINIYQQGDGANVSNAATTIEGDQKIFGTQDPADIVRTLTAEMSAQREQYAAQFSRLFDMLEREQEKTAELIKHLQ